MSWTDFYVQPDTEVYWYDVATNTYNVDNEPSPAVEYYTYDVETESFQPFEATPIEEAVCPV